MSEFLMNRRKALGVGLGAGLASLTAYGQPAAAWPTKPIRAVVGYAPGGGNDLMVRALAPTLGQHLGQSIVVENKPGAVGNLAAADIVRSAPDGYNTLFTNTTQQTVNPYILKNSPDVARELVPVATFGRFLYYLMVRNNLKARSISELVALAKEQPGKLTFASYGPGSLPHLLAEIFQQQAGIKLIHVPYRGAAPSLQALMADEVDMVFDPGLGFQYVEAGRLRALAITTADRSTRYPHVPTFVESGVRVVEGTSWVGVWVPKGTPRNAIDAMAGGLQVAVNNPEARKLVDSIGAELVFTNEAGFKELLRTEEDTMSRLIRERKIMAD